MLRGDVAAFEGLVEEAAIEPPKGLHDEPDKTVLTRLLGARGR